MAIVAGTLLAIAVVGALYWARSVFIPVALAVFLTFVLSPIVVGLQKLRLPRSVAVITAVTLTAAILAGTFWIVGRQVGTLADDLPNHTQSIKDKIENLKSAAGQKGSRFGRMIDEIGGAFRTKPAEATAREAADETKTPAVVVESSSPSWMGFVGGFAGAAAEILAQGALVIVLVVFMLLNREDLRNRIIRLIGDGRLTVTTKAVDDATRRISRFLFMQFIVNATYGATLAVGLYFLDVDYAFLWGFLAATLRYIPYLGAWLAAILPVSLSIVESHGWTQPLLVIGFIVVLELISNNVMEPLMYGHSIGVSEVALLVAAAFWTFLWGPVGLVLAAPLTVCLLVLGRYVPQLEFLRVLLGDEPPLEKDLTFYQRLTARDQDEAEQLALRHAEGTCRAAVFDDLLVPALRSLKEDRQRNQLAPDDERFIIQAVREIAEEFDSDQETALRDGDADDPPVDKARVIGCPASDEADQLALELLARNLDARRWEVEITSFQTLAAEVIERIENSRPAVVCIASLAPGGLAHTRYLIKRIRGRFPKLRIVVARWGMSDDQSGEQRARLQDTGADGVEPTLRETVQHLNAWLPALARPAPADEPTLDTEVVGASR
jgi:predicted PurR-regulated permease PerM